MHFQWNDKMMAPKCFYFSLMINTSVPQEGQPCVQVDSGDTKKKRHEDRYYYFGTLVDCQHQFTSTLVTKVEGPLQPALEFSHTYKKEDNYIQTWRGWYL